eukprot:1188009-Rhodomonas_salina.2
MFGSCIFECIFHPLVTDTDGQKTGSVSSRSRFTTTPSRVAASARCESHCQSCCAITMAAADPTCIELWVVAAHGRCQAA